MVQAFWNSQIFLFDTSHLIDVEKRLPGPVNKRLLAPKRIFHDTKFMEIFVSLTTSSMSELTLKQESTEEW